MSYKTTDSTLKHLVLDASNPLEVRMEALEAMQRTSIQFLRSLEAESQPVRLQLAAAKRRKAIETDRALGNVPDLLGKR